MIDLALITPNITNYVTTIGIKMGSGPMWPPAANLELQVNILTLYLRKSIIFGPKNVGGAQSKKIASDITSSRTQ